MSTQGGRESLVGFHGADALTPQTKPPQTKRFESGTLPEAARLPEGSPDMTSESPTDSPGSAPPPSAQPPPGWYADPWAQAGQRWWDGQRWTEHTTAPPAPPQNRALATPASQGTKIMVAVTLGLGVLGVAIGGATDAGRALLLLALASVFVATGLMIRHRMREPGSTPESRATIVFMLVVVIGVLLFVVGYGIRNAEEGEREAERAIDCINNPSAFNPACD
jgi:hypothetical protein